ncbi:MAG: ISAzo13 family transposase, partial [Firmicutes bacterium]|nr:ISAzo13 family transposase [Bacillota bacterium]
GHLAGDPMNENVIWLNINASGIRKELARRGVKISLYHVQKLIKRCGLKKRSFRKNIPLKSVEGRDEQFVKIKNVIELCIRLGIPIISIDTKKKEIIG